MCENINQTDAKIKTQYNLPVSMIRYVSTSVLKRFSVSPSEDSFLTSGSQHAHTDSTHHTQQHYSTSTVTCFIVLFFLNEPYIKAECRKCFQIKMQMLMSLLNLTKHHLSYSVCLCLKQYGGFEGAFIFFNVPQINCSNVFTLQEEL